MPCKNINFVLKYIEKLPNSLRPVGVTFFPGIYNIINENITITQAHNETVFLPYDYSDIPILAGGI